MALNIKKLLVSQPKPASEKSPYFDIAEKYGVEIVDRPKIKPIKKLDLTGKEGEKLVRLLTKKILIRHEKTFKRLADM